MKQAFLPLCVACAVLAGCHASYGYRFQGGQAGMASGGYSQTSAVDLKVGGTLPSDGIAGAILVGVMLADGMRYYLRLPDGTRTPYYGVPDADPARLINVQDCTRPIDLKAGNLMCR